MIVYNVNISNIVFMRFWRSIMKKWYDEEYEFEIEVISFLHSHHKSGIDGMVRKSAINILVLMAAL